ncbi:MAG: hypothetical protein ACLU1V_14505 [Bacteroides fragilis]
MIKCGAQLLNTGGTKASPDLDTHTSARMKTGERCNTGEMPINQMAGIQYDIALGV